MRARRQRGSRASPPGKRRVDVPADPGAFQHSTALQRAGLLPAHSGGDQRRELDDAAALHQQRAHDRIDRGPLLVAHARKGAVATGRASCQDERASNPPTIAAGEEPVAPRVPL